MADVKKLILSGSVSGKGILVVQTVSPGTLLHTVHATNLEEIWLYASNPGATARNLTIQWGGVGAVADASVLEIPVGSGLVCVVPGLILTGGLIIRAFAAAASEITIFGYSNILAQN